MGWKFTALPVALVLALALVLPLLVSACGDLQKPAKDQQTVYADTTSASSKAERLISAFYSFESTQLAPLLLHAPESASALLFYQGWAQGGNYKIVQRHPCVMTSASVARCSIQVDDDLVLALNRAHKVTDTFTIHFAEGNITAVETSSDDEPIYREAFDWVVESTPELMNRECVGFFDGGPTPAACARSMAEGYRRFIAQHRVDQ